MKVIVAGEIPYLCMGEAPWELVSSTLLNFSLQTLTVVHYFDRFTVICEKWFYLNDYFLKYFVFTFVIVLSLINGLDYSRDDRDIYICKLGENDFLENEIATENCHYWFIVTGSVDSMLIVICLKYTGEECFVAAVIESHESSCNYNCHRAIEIKQAIRVYQISVSNYRFNRIANPLPRSSTHRQKRFY